MTDLAATLASSSKAFYIAPAGCGKTELIARAVQHNRGKPQLILTHTHAGVNSLRNRLRKVGLSPHSFSVTTIASFAQQYVSAYPNTCSMKPSASTEPDWLEIYTAATRLFDCSVGKNVLRESFSGIYVDEYQDCTMEQHDLVVQLSSLMACRILGDPLQGIYDFCGGGAFSWRHDIADKFERIQDTPTPWRWQKTNPELGSWLLKLVRPALKNGNPIDLRNAPPSVHWQINTPTEQRRACMSLLSVGRTESVIAIHKFSNEAHRFARNIGGAYTSMDEIEGKDLISWAGTFDRSRETKLALAVINFACECLTSVNAELGAIRQRLESGKPTLMKGIRKHTDVARQLEQTAKESTTSAILAALKAIGAIQDCRLFRHELWWDMRRTLEQQLLLHESTLAVLARDVRDRKRIIGHSIAPRTVSRVLLIKGLEFDHAIILNAEALTAKELYVAMTRGCRSLTVLSPTPIIQLPAAYR